MKRHGGPYRQADSIKWKLYNRFEKVGLGDLRDKCRLSHAVWLPSFGSHELDFIDYSPEASREITLCKTDLKDPISQITRIMKMNVNGRDTRLSESEAEEALQKVLFQSSTSFQRTRLTMNTTTSYSHGFSTPRLAFSISYKTRKPQ